MALQADIKNHWYRGGTLVRLIMLNIGLFLALRLVDLVFFLFGIQGPDLMEWLKSSSDPACSICTPLAQLK